nr:SKI family transcriptional corepressor 1 [Pelodiscus sinensis]|eukprot:XP_025044983.1 SKI family transcriptional corepressor 1 [Pelodiscus sinensis]
MEAIASQLGTGREGSSSPNSKQELQPYAGASPLKPNQVGETSLYGVPIVSLVIDGQERLCLAQISNTLLKNYSYNEIHNRRVALGITCVQCTPPERNQPVSPTEPKRRGAGGGTPPGLIACNVSFCFSKAYAPEREEPLPALKNPACLAPLPAYLCNPEANEQDKDDNHSTAEDLEPGKSYQDQRNVSHASPANTDRGEEALSMDFMGTPLVEKDIENLARDELQKLLLEQMELRKKLEREFQSLKDNFQDQMKRELAYREEMVQQLQIVRDTLCNELDQERKARYAIQQKLKEAHDALHHFSCKMLTPRHCTGNCSFKPPLLPQ